MSYLMRIEPFRGLSRVEREMDHMLRHLLAPRECEVMEAIRLPSVDIAETPDAVIVTAEMPGISKDDLDIQVLPDSLSLSAETHLESGEGEKDTQYLCRERTWERFSRTIALPAEVKVEEVTAKLQDGVLEIRLPKAEPARVTGPHRVRVE